MLPRLRFTIALAVTALPFPAVPTAVADEPFSVVEPVADEPTRSPGPPRPCGTGVLRVVDHGSVRDVEFPLAHTTVDARVAGTSAHVRVTQRFENPYETVIEAVYLFPLPHTAAVRDLEMKVGDRVVRGIVERRDEARRVYEAAKASGRVSTLLEQQRPNVFRQSVANIEPGARIEITIDYVEELETIRGTCELVFPMVVGPRYLPRDGDASLVPASFSPGDSAADAASDEQVNPPFLPPALRSGHDIDLTVEVDSGVPLRNLRSPTHTVEQTTLEASRARVRLHPLDRVPNKDFVLRWETQAAEPEAAVHAHRDEAGGYLTVIVHAATELEPAEITPKEMVFVLDCSGSMRGEPIAASKALVRHALRNLRPDDTFRIVRFSNSSWAFHPDALSATAGNVERAIAFVEDLPAGGGTEMVRGIVAALDPARDPDRLRILLFLTDGFIGNENDAVQAIRDHAGDARVFGFGIGSSPNRFLLDAISREGRGDVHYHTLGADVDESIALFYDRIRNPYLTAVELSWEGVSVDEVVPQRIPDLFGGRPVVMRARYERGGAGTLVLRGRLGQRAWSKRIALELPEQPGGNVAVGTLWARSRVEELERSLRHAREDEVVERIVELGLAHHLVTSQTSFVAVAESTVASKGRPKIVHVPVPVPEGVSYEGAVGSIGRIEGVPPQAEVPPPPQAHGGTKPADSFFVRGCRSGETKTVVDGMPVSDAFQGIELEMFEITADKIPPLKKESSSASIRVIDTQGQPKIRANDARLQTKLGAIVGRTDAGLVITVEAAFPSAARDGTIEFVVKFQNMGSDTLTIPAEDEFDLEHLRVQVVRADGRVVFLGKDRSMTGVRLAPRESATRRVVVDLASVDLRGEDPYVEVAFHHPPWGHAGTGRVRVALVDR